MSEPTRYYAVISGAGEKEQQDIFHPYGVPFAAHPKGEWVRYEDYARLKAEVERLTKAGDAMHCFLIGYIVENRLSSSYLNKLDDGWVNAREVKS